MLKKKQKKNDQKISKMLIGMLLPLESESLGKYSTESEHVWNNCHMDWIVDRPNILNRLILFLLFDFLPIMDLVFIVSSHCSFSKLQLHVIKHFADRDVPSMMKNLWTF